MQKNRISFRRFVAWMLTLLMVLQTVPSLATGDLSEYSSVTSDYVEGANYAEVVFLAPDGVTGDQITVESRKVEKGAALGVLPDAPQREGYSFSFWQAEDGSVVTGGTIVENDMVVVASYSSDYPAFTAGYEDGSLSLVIHAPEGALPAGVTASLESVQLSDEQRNAVFKAVDSTGERDLEVLDAIDISFLDENGNKIQPNGNVSLSMSLKEKLAGSVSVVHLPDEPKPVLRKTGLLRMTSPAKGGSIVNTASTTNNTAPSQGEVVVQNITDSEFTFDAGSFSVYAVVGDTSAKYVFHYATEEYSFENELHEETTYQMVAAGGHLYNPGAPEAPSDMDNPQFMGWWTKNGNNWDKQVIPANVDYVTTSAEGLTEGQQTVIDLYARFSGTYYIVYHDETNYNILATETTDTKKGVSLKENGTLRVELVLTGPESVNKAFLGWAKQEGMNLEEYVVEDPFDFDDNANGTQHLYPVIAAAYWITFDKNDWKYTKNNEHKGTYDLINGKYVLNENGTGEYDRKGSGAEYVAPRFVLQGENYQTRYGNKPDVQLIPETTRPGYVFKGWIYEDGTSFNPDFTPTENVCVYADWEAEQSPYTVQYWLQNANGDGYDLVDVDLKLWSGETDTKTALTANTNLPYTEQDGTQLKIGNKYPHYKIHTSDDPNDPYRIVDADILGDESTIINVYYDCVTYTLRFIYARSSGQTRYEETTETSNVLYGKIENQYYRLIGEKVGTEYYLSSDNSSEYTATIYDANNNTITNPVYPNTYYRRTNKRNALSWLSRDIYTWTYTDTSGATHIYDGKLYKDAGKKYQITEDVSNFTTNNRSKSWSSIISGNNADASGSNQWKDVVGEPGVTMKDGYALGSFTSGIYTYYYLDITHLKYGQEILGVWPYNSLQKVGNYSFVSWGVQYQSPYYNSRYDEWVASAGDSSRNGLFTIKGSYTYLDELMFNVENNGNTELPNGDILASVLFGRYKTTNYVYDYKIYVDLLDNDTVDDDDDIRNYNGVDYKYFTTVEDVTSTANLSKQAALGFDGLEHIAGPFNDKDQSATTNGGDVYFYYQRACFNLNIFRNHKGDTGSSDDDHATKSIKYGEDISNYLSDGNINPFAGYVIGETRYTADDGEEFVFTGWYSVPEYVVGENMKQVDLTDKTMNNHLFIYAGWRPVRYRAWVQPNGGEFSESESTWFNLNYGEVIGNYGDITRDYLRDDENGEYYYVIYDHEEPRSAKYVKISEATDDQIAHALKDGNEPIKYSHLKNAYALVGWYEVLDEDFGTYEQYYANDLENDGTYTVRPPTINESDTLSTGTYVFGTPVTDDIAIRALWRRAGTIAVEFLPTMKVGEETIKGTVPEGIAAKTDDGKFIISYNDEGKVTESSETATSDQWIYPLSDQVYADLSNMQAQAAPEAPAGYYFVGWMTPYGVVVEPNNVFTIYADLARLIDHPVASDVPWYRYTLTAVYAKIKVVSLTYDYNAPESEMLEKTLTDVGGQADNTQIDTSVDNKLGNLMLNHQITLSTGAGFDRGPGYKLIGWTTKKGGTTVEFKLGETADFIDDEDNTTLYAVWQPMGYLKIGKHFDVQEPYLDGVSLESHWQGLTFTILNTDTNEYISVKDDIDPDNPERTDLGICDGTVPADQISESNPAPTVTLASFNRETTQSSNEHQYFYYVWVPAGNYKVEENHNQADTLLPGYTRQNTNYYGTGTVPAQGNIYLNTTSGIGEARINNNYRGPGYVYLDVQKQVTGDAPAATTNNKTYTFVVRNDDLSTEETPVYIGGGSEQNKYTTNFSQANKYTIKPGEVIQLNNQNLNSPGKIKVLAGVSYTVIELDSTSGAIEDPNITGYDWTKPADITIRIVNNNNNLVTITNRYEKNTGTLTIRKNVSGLQTGDVVPAETEFTVTDGEDYTETFTYGDMTNNSYTLNNVPIDATYTVTEDGAAVGGYKLVTTYGDAATLNSETLTGTLTVTNTYSQGSLIIQKTYSGLESGHSVPVNTAFTVYKDGKEYARNTYSQMSGGIWTLSDVPIGSTYSVIESGAGLDWYDLGTEIGNPVTLTDQNTSGTIVVNNVYTRKTATIEATKKVTGNMGDRSAEFSFTATFAKTNGITNTETFTLSHGQKKTFQGVEWGTVVTIQETTGDNYETSSGLDSDLSDGASVTINPVENEKYTVTFKNNREVEVDTGVSTDSKPYWFLLGLIPLAGLGAVLMAKKRRRDEA